MKIAVFDSYQGKFIGDTIKAWETEGHEVVAAYGYDPNLVDWADIVWFETCDNNLHRATVPWEEHPDWHLQARDIGGTKVIVRVIDIEAWYGHHKNVDWQFVDDVIFIAPHIREVVEKDIDFKKSKTRVHEIPCGVDLSRYEYKIREPGKNIAIISEKWTTKGTDLILQVAYAMKGMGYKFHWLGKWSDHEWEKRYFQNFIIENNLPFEFYDWADSVDEWLEDKNYLLHASHKEAFSYATAEAMAKGIKPVLHAFYGSDELWPGMTWNGVSEAVEKILEEDYDSALYLDYLLASRFTLDHQVEAFHAVIRA